MKSGTYEWQNANDLFKADDSIIKTIGNSTNTSHPCVKSAELKHELEAIVVHNLHRGNIIIGPTAADTYESAALVV